MSSSLHPVCVCINTLHCRSQDNYIRYRERANHQFGVSACSADVRLGGASGSTEVINKSTIVEDRTGYYRFYTVHANNWRLKGGGGRL